MKKKKEINQAGQVRSTDRHGARTDEGHRKKGGPTGRKKERQGGRQQTERQKKREKGWTHIARAKEKKNPDAALKTRTLKGTVILKDMTYDNGIWKNGTIYDPESGNTYKATIKLKSDRKSYFTRIYRSSRTWQKLRLDQNKIMQVSQARNTVFGDLRARVSPFPEGRDIE